MHPAYLRIDADSIVAHADRLRHLTLDQMEKWGLFVDRLSLGQRPEPEIKSVIADPWPFYSFLVRMRNLASVCPDRTSYGSHWPVKEALAYCTMWGVKLPCEFPLADPDRFGRLSLDEHRFDVPHKAIESRMVGLIHSLSSTQESEQRQPRPGSVHHRIESLYGTRLQQHLDEKYARWKPRPDEPWAYLVPVDDALTLIAKRRASACIPKIPPEFADENEWPSTQKLGPLVAIQAADVVYVALEVLTRAIRQDVESLRPSPKFVATYANEPRMLRFLQKASFAALGPVGSTCQSPTQTRTLVEIENGIFLRPCVRNALNRYRNKGDLTHLHGFFLRQSLFRMGLNLRELYQLLSQYYRKADVRDHQRDIEDLERNRHRPNFGCRKTAEHGWCPFNGDVRQCREQSHSSLARAAVKQWGPVILLGSSELKAQLQIRPSSSITTVASPLSPPPPPPTLAPFPSLPPTPAPPAPRPQRPLPSPPPPPIRPLSTSTSPSLSPTPSSSQPPAPPRQQRSFPPKPTPLPLSGNKSRPKVINSGIIRTRNPS